MIKKAADNTQYKKLAISVCGKLKRLQSQLFILPPLSDITKKPVVINFTNRFNSFAIIY